MVRTLGFDSSNPGSNPGETYSPLAQLAERSTVNRKVAGSNPARSDWRKFIRKPKNIKTLKKIHR